MELYKRKDFIQIDYDEKTKTFMTVCITEIIDPDYSVEKEKVTFSIMQRFKDNLEECIKFTIGAMSAVRLFKEGMYRPVDYIEIIYTDNAKRQIASKKYRIAEFTYPDLKDLKRGWKS